MLTHRSYGYEINEFVYDSSSFYFCKVKNKIGEYIVAPPFGDYLYLDNEGKILKIFFEENINFPINIKLMCKVKPVDMELPYENSGFIHQIEFESYNNWRFEKIKAKFRNQIVQAEKKKLEFEVSNNLKSLKSFYKMHTNLRINKFNEIPQPWIFFESIYEVFFKKNNGFVINAFSPNGKLIAGILVVINKNIAYYKFSASYLNALKYQPNNFLMDKLIKHCDSININILNLGYTGSSHIYQGLRHYKLNAGANEYCRFLIKSPSIENLGRDFKKVINKKIFNFLSNNPSNEKILNLSNKYYKYFI